LSSKSLRKRKKAVAAKNKNTKSLNANLHLVAGEYKHDHTHSITPISANEIQSLYDIDPSYPERLFTLMENSLEGERKETQRYYDAVEREQENDKLSITTQSRDTKLSILMSVFSMVFLTVLGSILIYFEHEVIGGTIVTTVLLGIVRAILLKKSTSKLDDEE